MARSFLSGLAWGGATVVVTAAVLSAVSPLAPPPTVEVAAPPGPSPSDTVPTASVTPTQQGPTLVPGGVSVVQSPDAPEGIETLAEAREPASLPAAGGVDTPTDASQAPRQVAVATPAAEPVRPAPLVNAPAVPAAEPGVAVTTAPAEPPAAPAPDASVTVAPEVASVTEPSETQLAVVVPPQEPGDAGASLTPRPLPKPLRGAEAIPEVEQPQVRPDTTVETSPATEPEPGTEDTQRAEEAVPSTERAEKPQVVARVAPAGEASTSNRLQIGRPAGSLVDRGDGARSSRLPSLAGTPSEQAVPDEASDATFDGRPVAQFARSFENPDNKPLMSIVLMDDGQDLTGGAVGLAALRSFPYPISFAVRADLPDAAARMAAYRGEGFEVLATVNLPVGATATDAEVTLEAALSGMPEIVGVLEGTDAGIQESRALSDQVAAILQQTGHGLVVQSKGLNTAAALARKEGVPAAPVFRDIDSKDQTPTVIRRFLDQAAFKAKQEGAVIMLGRARPDTISALLVWGLADRAGTVALAPVSAVLTR